MAKALRSGLEHIDRHIKEVRARRRQIVKLLRESTIEPLGPTSSHRRKSQNPLPISQFPLT
jgi:hypothetical protein